MAQRKITSDELITAWRANHRNAAAVGRQLGVTRQTVLQRVYRLMAQGVDIPPPLPPGHVMTPEYASKISKLRRAKHDSSEAASLHEA